MPSALRPGQKVMLTGEVLYCLRPGIDVALDCGDDDRWIAYNVPLSALTPVVEPEPSWVPGDVVRIDGANSMLFEYAAYRRWRPANDGWPMARSELSQRWREGCVEVIYRKEADK